MEKLNEAVLLEEQSEHVVFTADQQAVFHREIRDQIMGYATLGEILESGRPLPRDLTRNILYLGESHNAEMCKLTGIETDSSKERDERYLRVRELNARVRELEQQMGSAASMAQTVAHLGVLAAKLNYWWDLEGFGHISKLSFNQYGALEVEFSCHLFGDFALIGSITPVSDKTRKQLWLESLTNKGFMLHTAPDERDPVLLDNDHNRRALTSMLKTAFPSCDVVETTNHNGRDGVMTMRGMHVYIRKVEEVDALPLKPKKA